MTGRFGRLAFVFALGSILFFGEKAEAQEPVDDLTGYALFDPRWVNGISSFAVSVTNTSGEQVAEPLWVEVSDVAPGAVMVVDNNGWTSGGYPYFDLSAQLVDGLLSPGETVSSRISFANPDRIPFNFTVVVWGGRVGVEPPPQAPMLDPYSGMTMDASVTITGTALESDIVRVVAPTGTFDVSTATGHVFSATVPLSVNKVNHVFFIGVSSSGAESAVTAAAITQDSQPPTLFVDFPANNATVSTQMTDVAGRVGDVLSGFMGLEVVVNGVMAEVAIGIGTNGTFLARDVPLDSGVPTVVTAMATDVLGNSVAKQITVTYAPVPPNMTMIRAVSGNAQSGPVLGPVADPLVVEVLNGDGSPVVGKVVTFQVTRSDGRLATTLGGTGSLKAQVLTNSLGRASAFWKLGADAGCGNNRVEARSNGVAGSADFCATATPGPAAQINVGSGHMQRVETQSTVPLPLVAWVSDACNGISGVPVTFTVVGGDANFAGESAITQTTSATGHAKATLRLGQVPGNTTVQANFPGNPVPAVFTVYGVRRGYSQPTRFNGIVLNNGGQPVVGATCSLTLGGNTYGPIPSGSDGTFLFADVPASGPGQLHVDGQTAFHVGDESGADIPPGSYPSLHFEVVVVASAENSLGSPVLLPPLDPANTRTYDGTSDVVLTVDGVDGLSMLIKAGSMARADGTVPSPGDPAFLSLNAVHHDDVPMPMPDGAAPPFAWTLQPGGATFDPPVTITYPNMSGLPAGAIAYFLSFNHETNQFEIVSSGRVSDDASEITSDPGSGISVAGWGCNCPPYSVVATCESCDNTDGGGAVIVTQSVDADGVVAQLYLDGTRVRLVPLRNVPKSKKPFSPSALAAPGASNVDPPGYNGDSPDGQAPAGYVREVLVEESGFLVTRVYDSKGRRVATRCAPTSRD